MSTIDQFTATATEVLTHYNDHIAHTLGMPLSVDTPEPITAAEVMATFTEAFRAGARAVVVEAALSLLEDQWNQDGFCGSCSWHAAWFEVAQDVEESLADQEIWVSCHRKDGEGGDHRGTYLSNPAAALLARLKRVLGKGK